MKKFLCLVVFLTLTVAIFCWLPSKVAAQSAGSVGAGQSTTDAQLQKLVEEQVQKAKRSEALLAKQEEGMKKVEAMQARQEALLKQQEEQMARFGKVLETWEKQQKQYQKYLDSLGK